MSLVSAYKKIISLLSAHRTEEIISYTCISFLILISLTAILYKADWILGDNYSFLSYTARGSFVSFLQNGNIGNTRFFPLAGQEFNLLPLLHLNSALAHYILVAIKFCLLVFFVWLIYSKCIKTLNIKHGLYAVSAIMLAIIITPSFFTVFTNVIFSESTIALLYAVFIYCCLRAENNENDIKWYILAFIAAFIATYNKETVFAFFCAYAFFQLLLFNKDIGKKEKIFNLALLFNGVLFLLLYYIFAWRGHNVIYRTDSSLSAFALLYEVFFSSKILILIFAAAVYRFIYIAFLKYKAIKIYDTILFASVVFIAEYLILGYSSSYYYFPAIVTGVLGMLAIFITWGKKEAKYSKNIFIVIISLLIVVLCDIKPSLQIAKDITLERVKVMSGLKLMSNLRQKGGQIYWYQPFDNRTGIRNLTNLYINFIEDSTHNIVIKDIASVPKLNENDVFLYSLLNPNNVPMVESQALEMLNKQKFEFYQFQTGCLVFLSKNNLEKINDKSI